MNPILKELGIKEWETQDPDFKKFYEWLGNNITAENLISEEEQQIYNEIPPDERLEGSDLQHEMDRNEIKYPGIMDVTPELVARKTEEVTQLAETQAVYQKIADDLQKHNHNIENDIDDAAIAFRKEEVLLKNLEEQCTEQVEKIEAIETTNMNMTTELIKFMRNNSGTETTFVHQLNLEEFYNRNESFGQSVDQFMLKNFKTEEHSNAETEEENKRDTENLEMSKTTLWMSWKEVSDVESEVYGQRSVLARLHQPIQPMSMATMKVQLAELTEQNRLLEIEKEFKWKSFESALRKEADLLVDLTVQEYTQEKFDQARGRMERYQKANSLLSEQLMLADILWIKANTDFERFERFLKMSFFEQYESEALACSKRTELMRNKSFDAVNNTFLKQLHEAIASPNGDCVDDFLKIIRKIQAMCKHIKFQSYADDIDAVRENIGSLCDVLQKLLYDGVFGEPTYNDQMIMIKSYNAKTKLKSSTAELNKLRTTYVAEYVRPMNQDKFFNAKQNLWIWFLTQPEDVLKVLSSLKAAATKSKKPEPKPIAGISRRK